MHWQTLMWSGLRGAVTVILPQWQVALIAAAMLKRGVCVCLLFGWKEGAEVGAKATMGARIRVRVKLAQTKRDSASARTRLIT